MKSSQFADAGPRIKSASRWRSCALFLSGMALVLGLASTAYGKKPVKPPPPPPEPPPPAEASSIYFINRVSDNSTNWWPHEYASATSPSGSGLTHFFEMWSNSHRYANPTPSSLDHSGKLFACVREIRVPLSEEWLHYEPRYIDSYGNEKYTSLVICNEAGTEPIELIPGTLLELYPNVRPRWFADDTMIAFLAREVIPNPPLPEEIPPSTLITIDGVPGTLGIYVVEVEFDGAVAEPVGQPYLIPWTSSLWYEDEWDIRPTLDGFTLTPDGSIIYYTDYRDHLNGDWTRVLNKADFLSGSGKEELAVNFNGPELDPGGTRLLGWTDESSRHAIKLVSLATGQSVTIPPPNKRGWLRPTWAPDGESMVFSQYTLARGLRDFKLMVANADGTGATEIRDDESTEGPLGWISVP